MRHVCVVHNNVDQRSSIGKLAAWSVETALEANLEVTVVARDLDAALRSSVSWRPLYVPPRLHAVQWAVARPTIRHALRGVKHDVLHVYQPQVAAIADTWHVEFLSRVAIETSEASATTLRSQLGAAQHRLVAAMEDRYLSRLGGGVTALFCSAVLERHFARLYGPPAHHAILTNPAFDRPEADAPSRSDARARLRLPPTAFVAGYLGGFDPRKGYTDLVPAFLGMPGEPGILLMAGPGSPPPDFPATDPRIRVLGMLREMADFWAAIDVLVVPSRFEPFGMVVTEAAAARCAVIATPEVGAADLVSRFCAGEVVERHRLGDALQRMRDGGVDYSDGARALAAAVDADKLATELLLLWEQAWARRTDLGDRNRRGVEESRDSWRN